MVALQPISIGDEITVDYRDAAKLALFARLSRSWEVRGGAAHLNGLDRQKKIPKTTWSLSMFQKIVGLGCLT